MVQFISKEYLRSINKKASQAGPLKSNQSWSAQRKGKVVLRLLRGESVQALSCELGVEIYRLEE